MTPADKYILEFMASHELKMKPASISLNLPYSQNWVGQRCPMLASHGLLETEKGGYWISELGKRAVGGDLDDSELEALNDEHEE